MRTIALLPLLWLFLCAQASPLPPDTFDRSDAPEFITDPNDLPSDILAYKPCAQSGEPICMQKLGDYFLSARAHNPNESLFWHRKVALEGYIEGAIGASAALCSFNGRSWEYTENYTDHADRFIEGIAWTLLLLESEQRSEMKPERASPDDDFACSLLRTAIQNESLSRSRIHSAAHQLANRLRFFIGHSLRRLEPK